MNPQDAPEILRTSSQRMTFFPPAATAMQILWRGCKSKAPPRAPLTATCGADRASGLERCVDVRGTSRLHDGNTFWELTAALVLVVLMRVRRVYYYSMPSLP